MAYRIVLPSSISQKIGAFGLSRALMLKMLARMRHELENNADKFRGQRIEGHEERLFRFRLTIIDAGCWHDFGFAVDDATAQGTLFIREILYRKRPIPE